MLLHPLTAMLSQRIQRMCLTLFVMTLVLIVLSAATQADERPSDVRILVDISGSMKETDPNNLRIPATQLLVEMLPEGSDAGIWTFGRYVNMLVRLGAVDDNWRAMAREAIPTMNSVGLFTNLTEVLERAQWQISADSPFQQHIILLTDGMIDMPNGNEQERQRLFMEVLPRYVAAGARIHTVALSEYADKAMLQQISLETSGLFLEVSSADELLTAFLRVFDRSVPVEQVPMDNNAFTIDNSVNEFTALVFRRSRLAPVRLIAPSGAAFTAENSSQNDEVRWHEDQRFDLITIKNPEVGRWQAEADLDPNNRVQILSDLKLRVSGLPNTIFAGNPVDVLMALTNHGDTITEPSLLRLTDVSIKVTAPDGRFGSKLLSDPEQLPPDGVWRESLTRLSHAGRYEVEVTAVGRTFERRQVLTAHLMEPMTVFVEPNPAEQYVMVGVRAEAGNIDTGLSRVLARVASPDGSSLINTTEFDAETQSWRLRLQPDKGPGQYEVTLNIRGVTEGGATFRTAPETLRFEFPLVTDEAVAEIIDDAPVASSDRIATNDVEPDDIATPEPDASIDAESTPAVVMPPLPTFAAQAPVAVPAPTPAVITPSNDTEVELDADKDGVPVWVYITVALTNMAIFAGAGWWWLRRRQQALQTPEQGKDDVANKRSDRPDDLDTDDISEDDFDGDFDSFADDSEEEIPAADLPPTLTESMGSDADMMGDFDDEFALDDAVNEGKTDESSDAAEDDWGEFDDAIADLESEQVETDEEDKPDKG
ncbi:MAG: VWA domain-containing protein [Bacterioplanes sp.]|nr:VWA domain-containing protein [Bacterioplanes sp.]